MSLCANISSVKAKVISVLHFAPTHYIDTIKNNFFISEKLQLNLRLWVLDFILFLRWIFFRKNKYTKEIYRELNNIILMSEHLVLLSNKFIDNLPVDFDKSKISVINNPVEIPTNSLLESKEKCICWLGRVEFGVKRVDRMLKVWKIVSGYFPDWKLLICGSGDNVFFKKLASKMKLKNVTFYGFVNDIHDIYRRSRIVCNTSSTEAWGMTLVEGASYGCIPVAFDNFASVYDVIVNEKTGFIIKSFNYKEFAEKLMLLMRDPEMEFNMARCSVEHMKNFSKEKIARKYIALFQEILNKQYEKNSFSFSRSRE